MNDITAPSLLDQGHLNQLNQQLENLRHAQRHIDQFKLAGNDTTAMQTELDNAKNKILAYKRAYFPGQ